MVNDPISDMLIRIKNAGMVGKTKVSIPYSKLKHAVADVLQKEGYVDSVEKKGRKIAKHLEIVLKYNEKNHVIRDVARVSKPSRRIYLGANDIRPVRYGMGILVLSTPKGILTGKQARKAGVGGEALFTLY